MRTQKFSRWCLIALPRVGLGLYGMCQGCSTGEVRSPVQLGSTSAGNSEGDWNDVDAAVLVGVHRAEMAIAEMEGDPSSSRRVYILTTSREEPAKLVLTRVAGTPKSPAHIALEAEVGRFGDKARERLLLKEVEERLGELKGVD